MKIFHFLSRACAPLALALAAAAPAAAAFPEAPIKLVIPFPPGGGTDGMARLIALKLSNAMGNPVIVENRAGGDTIIAATAVANARPDGYTLLMGHMSTMALNPYLYSKLPYDPLKDFEPISQLTVTSIGIVANKNLPVGNLQELIDYARKNPGKATYGAAVLVTKLLGESIKKEAGIDLLEVPYKGSGPVLQALLSGEIDFAVADLSPFIPHVKAGTLKGIVTSGTRRYSDLPDTPTTRESGYPNLEMPTWFGLFAPAKTPPAIVGRLNAELGKVLNDPEVVAQLRSQYGYETVATTPAELTALIKADMKKWGPVITSMGIKPY